MQEHILSDEDIKLTGFYISRNDPKKLRTVNVYDDKNNITLILLTNHFSWTTQTV
jgi:hypothetical protein